MNRLLEFLAKHKATLTFVPEKRAFVVFTKDNRAVAFPEEAINDIDAMRRFIEPCLRAIEREQVHPSDAGGTPVSEGQVGR